MAEIIDLFLHLDKHLAELVLAYGQLTYIILFLIVFCETGLVVTPFLPGDSLLFAAGAIASTGALSPTVLIILLFIAAVLGDFVNYHIGKYLGPKVFDPKYQRFFKKQYLERTQAFYDKHGGKTIIIARFVPIIRTFAPFLAGVGQMRYRQFAIYNITGAALWVVSFVVGGYLFGEIPAVKKNFTLVILAIIVISVMPAVIEVWRARRAAKTSL
jgi:membrane-associated protein